MIKRDAKYKHFKSVIGQYIGERVCPKDVFTNSTNLPAGIYNLYASRACNKCNRNLRRKMTTITPLPISTITISPSEHSPPSYATCDEWSVADSSDLCSPPYPQARPTPHGDHPTANYAGLHSIIAGNTVVSQQPRYHQQQQHQQRRSEDRPRAFIEECGPDLLCLNFSDLPKRCKTPVVNDLQKKRSILANELQELKRISCINEERIAGLFKRLNGLKLSLTLLNEEQQRLEHSKQIRAVNMRLLINMLRTKLENEHKSKHNFQRYEAETDIIRRLFEKFATLEELKMKLEYENTRSLYKIKELKRENAKLEEKRKELANQIDIIDSV